MAAKKNIKGKEKRLNKTVRFVKEIRAELKKVIWPNRKQLTNNTITVLLASLLVGAIIWSADFILTQIVEATLTG